KLERPSWRQLHRIGPRSPADRAEDHEKQNYGVDFGLVHRLPSSINLHFLRQLFVAPDTFRAQKISEATDVAQFKSFQVFVKGSRMSPQNPSRQFTVMLSLPQVILAACRERGR